MNKIILVSSIIIIIITITIIFLRKSHAEVAQKAVDKAVVAQEDAQQAKIEAQTNPSMETSNAAAKAQADAEKRRQDAIDAVNAAKMIYPLVSEINIDLNGNKSLQIHNISIFNEMNQPINDFKLTASDPYDNRFLVTNAILGPQDNHMPYISLENKGSSNFKVSFNSPFNVSRVVVTNRLNCPGECQERLRGALLSLKLTDGSDISKLLNADITQTFDFKTTDTRYKIFRGTIGSGAQFNCPGAQGVTGNGNWCQFTKLSDAQDYCNNPVNNCAGFSQQVSGGSYQVISNAQLNPSPNPTWNWFQRILK